ncbi:MAG: RNA polymerase sigma factor [Oscillospiraceae bacterium]|nr:RNA polymerase sigma factor [Oscillospiraceae bacterium]
MMDPKILEAYAERVYGYAVNRTYSRDEADELSQEILLTALQKLPKLREEDKFEPWLWGVANNVTKVFRRRMGKQRAMYSYDIPEDLSIFDEYTAETEELYDRLRTQISMLSAIYRDIIILYYYDGLSTKQISEKLNIPEGTVTWRLSAGRSKLKQELEPYQAPPEKGNSNMNESALRPVQLSIGIYGSGDFDAGKPFPGTYINDALSQNICYHCYEEARTVEDLAKLIGVPAYYIEDRIGNLTYRNALIEQPKGKYLTDFVIFSKKHHEYLIQNAMSAIAPIADRMIAAFKNLTAEIYSTDHYKGGKSENELFYLYSVLALALRDHPMYPEIPPNYDGNCWRYSANETDISRINLGISQNISGNRGSRGTFEYREFTYNKYKYHPILIYDKQINVCEDILTKGDTDDQYLAAKMIEEGYLSRSEDGRLSVNIPAFTKEQMTAFVKAAEKHIDPLMAEYTAIVERVSEGYQALFPKRLSDDAKRFGSNFFHGLLAVLFSYAEESGQLSPPETPYCEILIQHK